MGLFVKAVLGISLNQNHVVNAENCLHGFGSAKYRAQLLQKNSIPRPRSKNAVLHQWARLLRKIGKLPQ